MSKLDELIKKLCPDGVVFKEFWEISAWDKKFNGTTKEEQIKINKFKHISAAALKAMESEGGEIKLLSTGNYEGYTTEAVAKDFINEGEIFTIPSGGTANIKYFNGFFVDSGNIIGQSIDEAIVLTKFLYYWLINNNITIQSFFRGSGVKHPDMIGILHLRIPVPPLEVQCEIVHILDDFTLLSAELSAELKARQKQYEFYRDKLLYFDEKIPRRKLIDVSSISRGKRVTKKDLNENNEFPVYQNSLAPMGYYKDCNYEKNKTYIISAGAAGKIGFCKENFWAADDCLVVYNLKEVLDKYVYYYLLVKQDYIKANVRKASIPRLSREIIENIEIPIPSLERQEKIVNILDKLDKLCNDISEGLPAEIEARQKQYEYYRDKLLTFRELKVNE